eukprot:scaffold1809_cov386-Prasinococcus_capsulatus_cf.AAC.1
MGGAATLRTPAASRRNAVSKVYTLRGGIARRDLDNCRLERPHRQGRAARYRRGNPNRYRIDAIGIPIGCAMDAKSPADTAQREGKGRARSCQPALDASGWAS